MSSFAILGDDISVTAGSGTYRAYSMSVDKVGNEVGARAFEDAAGEKAIVMIDKSTNLTVNFRDNILGVFDVDDVVTVTIVIATVSTSYNVKVTNVKGNGAKDGIADFSISATVVPTVSA